MSDLSPEALRFLAFIQSSPRQAVTLRALEASFGPQALSRVKALRQAGLIEPADYSAPDADSPVIHLTHPSAYRLTVSGQDALELHYQRLDQEAQDKAEAKRAKEEDRAHAAQEQRKDHHHDYLVAVFEALLAFILGLVAENRLQIVAFFVQLFEK